MPRSRPEPAATPPRTPGYAQWSRDPAVGVFMVLPLWLLYEGLRTTLAPDERNGVEVLLGATVDGLGMVADRILRVALALTVLGAAWSIHRRRVPWARVAAVSALEGTIYGLMLGPAAAALASSSTRVLGAGDAGAAGTGLTANLVGSLGAGIFEELLFRLVLVSVLSLFLTRAAAAFGVPRLAGVLAAVAVSALLFSAFHHVGPGAPPLRAPVFLFRTAAGLLLGLLFVFRGFGVCVYTHAMYDIHFYMVQEWQR